LLDVSILVGLEEVGAVLDFFAHKAVSIQEESLGDEANEGGVEGVAGYHIATNLTAVVVSLDGQRGRLLLLQFDDDRLLRITGFHIFVGAGEGRVCEGIDLHCLAFFIF